MTSPRIAIVGAGLSGLACARHLQAKGVAVELFDKAGRPGGRMASRQLSFDGRTVLVDHGAQYFTARTPAFRSLCDEALAAGVIAPWTGLIRDERAVAAIAQPEARYLGRPDMNALPRWLARGLSIHCKCDVTELQRTAKGWSLACAGGVLQHGFDALVVALPAEQAATLLSGVAPTLAAEARAARSAPCWAGIFGYGDAARWPDWQALRPREGHPLGWLARSRDGHGLIVHATPAWSRAHLEDNAGAVQAALLESALQCAPDLGAPEVATVHHWRYALVEQVAGSPYGFDPGLALGVCGDWRLGPRVELAWVSGEGLGAAISRGLLGQ